MISSNLMTNSSLVLGMPSAQRGRARASRPPVLARQRLRRKALRAEQAALRARLALAAP